MAVFLDVVGNGNDQNNGAADANDNEEHAVNDKTSQPALDGLLKIFVRKRSAAVPAQNSAANGQIDEAN